MRHFALLYLLALIFPLHVAAQEEEEVAEDTVKIVWTTNLAMANANPASVENLSVRSRSFDLSTLGKFGNLKGLRVTDIPLANLEFLRNIPQLEVLELYGNSLRDFGAIPSLKNLRELTVNFSFITDVSPLATMDSLRILKLYDNDIVDVSPLAKLVNLIHLDLSLNNISSISALAPLVNLKVFSVYNNPQIKDHKVLRNFTKLNDLNLSLTNSSTFSLVLLKNMRNMINLRIQGMVRNNKDLLHIKDLVKIKQLTMGLNDSVSDLSPLRNMTGMEYLDIHSNNVSDISVLANFPELKKVVLYKNKIEDVSPLTGCSKLWSLFLYQNPVKDYTPLYQIKSLKILKINDNALDENAKYLLKKNLPGCNIIYM